MPLPECNYCGAEYDPYDVHTFAGNQIYPRRKKEDDFSPEDNRTDIDVFMGGEPIKFEAVGPAIAVDGLTRQQVGEALDADRALASQVGGDHYRKMKIQPVEYIIANDIGFLPGNIIKYASRYPEKGGAEDIRKIIHYCKLILEFEYGERNGG